MTIQAPHRGLAEQPELQPRHLRAGPVDGGSPDAERRRPPRLAERVHRAVHARRRTAGCRTATQLYAAVEERAELEGHQPARARWPTTCSATARRRSRRAPAAAWSRTRSATRRRTTRPTRSSRTTAARGTTRTTTSCPTATCVQLASRTASVGSWLDLGLRQRQCRPRLRPRDHGRLGRAAVELGVLGRRPAGDRARGCRRSSATSAASTATSTSGQRGAEPARLHAVSASSLPTDARLDAVGADDRRPLRSRTAPSRTATSSRTASEFGKQTGALGRLRLSVDARLRNGLFLQGGVSTGKTMTDNCDIVDDVPEALHRPPARRAFIAGRIWRTGGRVDARRVLPPGDAVPDAVQGGWRPTRCRMAIRLSRHVPEPVLVRRSSPTNIYNNANRRAATTLGRPFTLGQPTVNVVEPGYEVWRPAEPDRSAVHEDRQRGPAAGST